MNNPTELSTVMNFVQYLLTVLGGAALLLFACSKWLFNIWDKRIARQEQHELDEKLKKLEAILNQQNHVKKSIFDEEFAIYRELSSKLVEQIKATGLLANAFFSRHSKTDITDQINLCNDCFRISKCAILAGRPFIDKSIYNFFDEVIEKYHTATQIIEQNFPTEMTDLDEIKKQIYAHLKSCDNEADKCLDSIGQHFQNYFSNQVQSNKKKEAPNEKH